MFDVPCCAKTSDVYVSGLVQVLHYLKEFSQRMVTRTTEIEKQVDTLVQEAKVRRVHSVVIIALNKQLPPAGHRDSHQQRVQ